MWDKLCMNQCIYVWIIFNIRLIFWTSKEAVKFEERINTGLYHKLKNEHRPRWGMNYSTIKKESIKSISKNYFKISLTYKNLQWFIMHLYIPCFIRFWELSSIVNIFFPFTNVEVELLKVLQIPQFTYMVYLSTEYRFYDSLSKVLCTILYTLKRLPII